MEEGVAGIGKSEEKEKEIKEEISKKKKVASNF